MDVVECTFVSSDHDRRSVGLRALEEEALERVLRQAMERTRTAFPGKQYPVRRWSGTRIGALPPAECRLAGASPFFGAVGRRYSPVVAERARNRSSGRNRRRSLRASPGAGILVPDGGGEPLLHGGIVLWAGGGHTAGRRGAVGGFSHHPIGGLFWQQRRAAPGRALALR